MCGVAKAARSRSKNPHKGEEDEAEHRFVHEPATVFQESKVSEMVDRHSGSEDDRDRDANELDGTSISYFSVGLGIQAFVLESGLRGWRPATDQPKAAI